MQKQCARGYYYNKGGSSALSSYRHLKRYHYSRFVTYNYYSTSKVYEQVNCAAKKVQESKAFYLNKTLFQSKQYFKITRSHEVIVYFFQAWPNVQLHN